MKKMETLIHAVRIYSQDIGMELGIEKCAMLGMKSGKWHLANGTELPNHDKIRTLLEMETYKYNWKLTPSNKGRGKKNKKNIFGETDNYLRQNYLAEALPKEKIPDLYSSLHIQNHSWSGPEKNLSKWTKEQEN